MRKTQLDYSTIRLKADASVVEAPSALNVRPRRSPTHVLIKGYSVDSTKLKHFLAVALDQTAYVAINHEERSMLAKVRQLPQSRILELREVIEDMLDEEEDKRDIQARRKLVQRARVLQDADP